VVFAKACELGLEGIVSKREGSFYRCARSRNFLKTKNPDFVRAEPFPHRLIAACGLSPKDEWERAYAVRACNGMNLIKSFCFTRSACPAPPPGPARFDRLHRLRCFGRQVGEC
jgi:hypothetical protein